MLAALAVAAQPCPEAKIQSGPWKGTPLHDAIRHNDVPVARRLMTPVTVNQRDSFGNTPLIAALSPMASIEPAGIQNPESVQREVAIENKARQAIVFALLAKGATADHRSATGTTPLMQLAAFGYSPEIDRRVAGLLLRSKSDVNAKDDLGVTALMLAAGRGKTGLVKFLLSHGADPQISNCRTETAASYAQAGGYLDLSRELAR